MKHTTLKAIVFTSILSVLVLSLNLVVGAQQHSKEHMATDQNEKSKDDKNKGDKNKGDKNKGDKKKSDASDSGMLSSSDKKFIIEAAEGGKMEVHMARMAVERAASDSIKQFSQRAIDDHSKANQELMQLAQQKGVILPAHLLPESDHGAAQTSVSSDSNTTGSNKMGKGDKKAHKDMMKLAQLSGADFDREYMREQVKHHEKAVNLFEKESMKGKDADVKAWAAATLPTLREHLRMARELNNSVSGKTASNTP